MAKQASPIVKLRGTIDDLSFYKSQDGYLAREKGGVDGDRIKSDPRFNRTRLNGLEFGIGGRAGKAFRGAFSTEITKAADNRVIGRVTKLMVAILQTDPVNDFGQRQVQNGELSQLLNFNFNNQMPFDQVFTLPVTTTVNRVTGETAIAWAGFTPTADIVAPEGNTHFNFFAAAAAIDFETGLFTTARQTSANLPLNDTLTAPGILSLPLPANSPLPIFMVMGIEFVKTVNGKVYPASKGQSPLQLILVDMP